MKLAKPIGMSKANVPAARDTAIASSLIRLEHVVDRNQAKKA